MVAPPLLPGSIQSPPPPRPPQSPSTSFASFPILVITVLGMLTTSVILVSYYLFVVRCRLSWRRHSSLFAYRRHRHRNLLHIPPVINALSTEFRGLDTSAIRSIPVVTFSAAGGKKASFRECAICLSEFLDEERLKLLPGCGHPFHIDCIDTWLQFNANCPLCRSDVVSSIAGSPTEHIVVLEPRREQQGGSSNNLPVEPSSEVTGETSSTNPSPRRKWRKGQKVGSMGDEFVVSDRCRCEQPMRRSFSMDSCNDRQLYLSIQEILRQSRRDSDQASGTGEASSSAVGSGDGGGSGRVRRSLFSFGRSSRRSVNPMEEIDV
ncbi:RING-H2 finger protein ATL16-like [Curcuma longa]|uniref:RING-H2 finger protein ATL16-like n=1 Tax=Curcuma longa TaxID=136217 RepID=UPI003D9F6856